MRYSLAGLTGPVFVMLGVLTAVLTLPLADARAAVVSVEPARQSLTALPTTQCVITFDLPINPLTVDASSFRVFGRWSGPVPGSLQTELGGTRIRFTPSRPFFAGEWVTVSLSKGITEATGDPIKAHTWTFWIRSGPGTLDQTQIANLPIREDGEAHIQSYGANAVDLNGDGWSDLSIPNEITNDVRVFLNDQGTFESFTIYQLPAGASPSTNDASDFDMDGNVDLAIGNILNDQVSVLMGDGLGGFLPEVSYGAANQIRGLAVVDCDGDGFDDIVTAQRGSSNVAVLTNDGSGAFNLSSLFNAQGDGESGCAVADANNDGILDLFLGAYVSRELVVYLGDGLGGFTFSQRIPAAGFPWMIALGDVNGDGNVDVVSANSVAGNVGVSLGDGSGGLGPVTTYPTGAFPLAIDVGDLDGDGDLDFVSSNFSGANWTVYENDGTGAFINRLDLPASAAGSCAILHDRDNDGDLDISAIDELDDRLFLFENNPSPVAVPDVTARTLQVLSVYPNPFNPRVRVRFEAPQRGVMEAAVFDLRGTRIAQLHHGMVPPGPGELGWNGTDSAGRPVASGVYMLKIEGFGGVQSQKLVLAR